jgi:asparagine synthase (glutamine-hydrolysing)
MCGIVGAVSLVQGSVPQLGAALSVMSRLISHRGPDGSGVWRSSNDCCGLAHRRLAIIDLSTSGRQPMQGDDGSVISFNGEIYNYRELRSILADHWSFRTNSDTEVILAAYSKWGTDCLQHLRGMFAFAIWDGSRLFCARDRFGIKPFYYSIINSVMYFASDKKA